MQSDGETECAARIILAEYAAVTVAATAAASPATAESAATASSAAACDVCRAKQLGEKVPRRKCSCASGLTTQRDRACDRRKEREERAATWRDPFDPSLHDELIVKSTPGFRSPGVASAQGFHFKSPEELSCSVDSAEFDDHRAHWEALSDWERFKYRLELSTHGSSGEYAEKLRSLLSSDDFARFARVHAQSLNMRLRQVMLHVCLEGVVDAVRHLMAAGMKVSDLITYYDNDGGHAPIAAQPLYLAAAAGSVDLARWLLQMGADPNGKASDGTSAFYVACQEGEVAILHLLRDHSADMTAVDQDGTSPVLIAAACGHVEVLRVLNESGVDLQAPGHIYVEDFTVLRRNATPLSIARELNEHEVVRFLEALLAKTEKRVRSDEPMLERAREAGVADRLKPIPASLTAATQPGSGSDEQIRAAKKQLKALQTANQQIVSRAEKQRLKQAKLV